MPIKRERNSPSYTSSPASSTLHPNPDPDDQVETYSQTPNTTPNKKSKSRSKSKSTPDKQTPIKQKVKADPDLTPGKKTGAWSREEMKLLYGIMCPKRTGVKWDEVSSQIPGRDAKSCNNKWFRVQGKILEVVEGLGE